MFMSDKVMAQRVIGNVTVKEPCMLLTICVMTLTLHIFKNDSKTSYMANIQYNHVKIYSLKDVYSGGKKPKTYPEQPHLVSGRFMKVFFKTTTCPKQPLSSGSKSGRLVQV